MKTICSIAILLVLLGCKNNSDAEVKTAPTQNKESVKAFKEQKDLNLTTSSSKVIFNDPLYNEIYETYLKVKGALVNTSTMGTQGAAVALSKSLDSINDASDATKKAVKTIINENDIKKQRAAFEIVSQNLEVLLSKNVASGTIYKQYCPMAFNGKGAYWLSDSKEVRNPYYGDIMLTCGVVDSEIESSN